VNLMPLAKHPAPPARDNLAPDPSEPRASRTSRAGDAPILQTLRLSGSPVERRRPGPPGTITAMERRHDQSLHTHAPTCPQSGPPHRPEQLLPPTNKTLHTEPRRALPDTAASGQGRACEPPPGHR